MYAEFYTLPITIQSTTSPFLTCLQSSEYAGSKSIALAAFMLSRRLLIWFPVLLANGRPSPSVLQLRVHLWYSGRGSNWISLFSYKHKHKIKRLTLFINYYVAVLVVLHPTYVIPVSEPAGRWRPCLHSG